MIVKNKCFKKLSIVSSISIIISSPNIILGITKLEKK